GAPVSPGARAGGVRLSARRASSAARRPQGGVNPIRARAHRGLRPTGRLSRLTVSLFPASSAAEASTGDNAHGRSTVINKHQPESVRVPQLWEAVAERLRTAILSGALGARTNLL